MRAAAESTMIAVFTLQSSQFEWEAPQRVETRAVARTDRVTVW